MDTIPKLFWKRLEKMSLDEERIFILFDLEMTPWQNEVENWVRIPRLLINLPASKFNSFRSLALNGAPLSLN